MLWAYHLFIWINSRIHTYVLEAFKVCLRDPMQHVFFVKIFEYNLKLCLIYFRKDFICFDWCAIAYWAFSVFVSNASSGSIPLDIFRCISCWLVAEAPAAAGTDWPGSSSAVFSPSNWSVSGVSSPSAPLIFNRFVKLPQAFWNGEN